MPGEGLEYAIRRLNWRRTHYGIVRMPGTVTQSVLPTLEAAEADRSHREAETRARVANPFICGPNHVARSRLPEPVFADWLRGAGIELLVAQGPPVNWTEWWEQTHKSLSPEQVEHVWAGLDRVQFFEVAARPAGSVGYAVVKIEWEYDDNWMEPGPEGGTPIRVFRRWATAEAFRCEQETTTRQALAAPNDQDAMQYEINRWNDEVLWPLGATPLRRDTFDVVRAEAAPFYEIVELELPAAQSGSHHG